MNITRVIFDDNLGKPTDKPRPIETVYPRPVLPLSGCVRLHNCTGAACCVPPGPRCVSCGQGLTPLQGDNRGHRADRAIFPCHPLSTLSLNPPPPPSSDPRCCRLPPGRLAPTTGWRALGCSPGTAARAASPTSAPGDRVPDCPLHYSCQAVNLHKARRRPM